MALINGIIPTSKFELIRDRIGEIFATEFANQAALTGNADLNPAIYIERFIPIDKTETPLINVCLSTGNYDNKDIKAVDGNYTYNIDFYTTSKSTDETGGDKLATLKLHRLMAIARAIIENPRYRTLGYSAPFNCSIAVNNFNIGDPVNNNDATHSVQGRMQVMVRVPETVELIDNSPKVSASITQVKLSNTDKGYRYEWGSLTSFAVSAGNSFTLPYEYSGQTVRLISDGTQSYNTGFTQVNDLITMINGVTFASGQIITLTLVVNDYTANITVQADGNSFTLPDAYEDLTILIVNDGTQSYTDFTQDGLEITMPDGVELTEGQVVTIWYGLQLVTVTATAGNQFILPSIYRNHSQVLVFDGTQSYNNTQFNQPEVITTMTNGVEFADGQELIIAVR